MDESFEFRVYYLGTECHLCVSSSGLRVEMLECVTGCLMFELEGEAFKGTGEGGRYLWENDIRWYVWGDGFNGLIRDAKARIERGRNSTKGDDVKDGAMLATSLVRAVSGLILGRDGSFDPSHDVRNTAEYKAGLLGKYKGKSSTWNIDDGEWNGVQHVSFNGLYFGRGVEGGTPHVAPRTVQCVAFEQCCTKKGAAVMRSGDTGYYHAERWYCCQRDYRSWHEQSRLPERLRKEDKMGKKLVLDHGLNTPMLGIHNSWLAGAKCNVLVSKKNESAWPSMLGWLRFMLSTFPKAVVEQAEKELGKAPFTETEQQTPADKVKKSEAASELKRAELTKRKASIGGAGMAKGVDTKTSGGVIREYTGSGSTYTVGRPIEARFDRKAALVSWHDRHRL